MSAIDVGSDDEVNKVNWAEGKAHADFFVVLPAKLSCFVGSYTTRV